jgi:hypothetical protein
MNSSEIKLNQNHPIEPTNEVEHAAFNEYQANLARAMATKTERLLQAKKRALGSIAVIKERFGDDPERAAQALGSVRAAERGMAITKDRIDLARPRQSEDISYRDWARENLGPAIREAIPIGLPLRFHGAPIYAARDIIASGGISSSVDRLGIETSYDVADQISVTTPDSLEVSLDSYTGLSQDKYFTPAGCLFAVLPATHEDVEAGKVSMLMGNVDFKEHPEQLVGIMTTPENIYRVKEWTNSAGIDPSLVVEFKEFPNALRAQSQELLARGDSLDW